MGVTVLQQYPMIENRTGPQTIEFLTKRVVALGAVQTGQFLVDCETYVSVPQLDPLPVSTPDVGPLSCLARGPFPAKGHAYDGSSSYSFTSDWESRPDKAQKSVEHQSSSVQRTLHVLHNSEQPASVFSILESGNKVVPLIADGLFDLLMYKISSIYTNKMQKMESKGPRFEIGDFCVKLGSVTINQNFKGVLVEVEYRPCVVPGSAWELMREFLQGFLGPTVSNQAPQYLQNRMNDIYQPLDTIQQYLEHFGQYRKATGVI